MKVDFGKALIVEKIISTIFIASGANDIANLSRNELLSANFLALFGFVLFAHSILYNLILDEIERSNSKNERKDKNPLMKYIFEPFTYPLIGLAKLYKKIKIQKS